VASAEAPPGPGVDEGGSWQVGSAEGGWWAVERAELIRQRLGTRLSQADLVVDIGCGRGEAMGLLIEAGAGFVVGLDYEVYPQWERHPGRSAHVVCDAARLPLRPGIADLVTSFDVIEHFADDRDPLASARAVVRPQGVVALTVPALPGLWSPYDDEVGHHRRYTRASLEAAARRCGLEPEGTTYFFSWLVPPAWLMRKRTRHNIDDASGGAVSRAVAGAVGLVCRAERAVLRRRRLPFGTSLWTACRPARTGT
jgi:SAM-dependent methyltransferase